MNSQALLSSLKDSLQYSSIVSQEFLPVSNLNDLITKEKVQNELPTTLMGRLFSDSLPSKISINARRIFAVLVIIGEPQAIRKLVDDGLTDEDLPLARPTHDKHSGTLESKGRQEVKSFKDWKNEAKVDMFLEKQWLFLAPKLDVTGTSTVFQVHSRCPLPFLRATELRGEHSNVVYKSELHAAHQTGSGVSPSLLQKYNEVLMIEMQRRKTRTWWLQSRYFATLRA